MEVHEFVQGFIAALVTKGMLEIRPETTRTRAGFRKTIEFLDHTTKALKEAKADPRTVRALSHIANELRSNGTGSFDGFEQALRREQLTLTRCPNPTYRQISFAIDDRYASWLINDLSDFKKAIVEGAVAQFAKEVG